MKLRNTPITVDLAPGKAYVPTVLHTDFGRLQVIERLDFWVVQTAWWAGEVKRVYLRLRTSGGVVDVYCEDGEWWLGRVMD